MKTPIRILSTLLSLAIAALCYGGVLFPLDVAGRLIVGSIWLLIAFFWAFGLIRLRGLGSGEEKAR